MISFTQGDALPLTLTCTDKDLTGATVTTIFPGKSGRDVVIPADQHEIDDDQTTNTGKVVCTITAAQSALVKDGDGQDMLCKVVQGSETIHFRGRGLLSVGKGTVSKS